MTRLICSSRFISNRRGSRGRRGGQEHISRFRGFGSWERPLAWKCAKQTAGDNSTVMAELRMGTLALKYFVEFTHVTARSGCGYCTAVS